MAVTKTLYRICKKSIQSGYVISNNEGLEPTDDVIKAWIAMEDALEVLDEFQIYLWQGGEIVGTFYIVDNRDKWDTEAVISDYDGIDEHDDFMSKLV